MKDLFERSRETFKRYYFALILFMGATLKLMQVIFDNYHMKVASIGSTKLILTLVYSAFLAIVIRQVIERLEKFKWKYIFYLAIPKMMFIVYFIILKDLNGFATALQYFLLCILTVITLFAIPFIGKKEDSAYYSYKALVSLVLTITCYILLIFGLLFTMRGISVLFEVTIKEYLYIEVAIFILGFIMPSLFLTLIPKADLKTNEYPIFINKVVIYIIFPLLSLYTFVLYVYFIRILVLFKWPANTLGDLIIYYSIISIGVLYFTTKLKKLSKWGNRFITFYPYALIVPNIMMLITFIIRIREYGVTEARYYGIMTFIVVILSVYIIKKVKKVKYIPLTLSVLLLISIFGPLSAFSISKDSQEKRLEQILINNHMLQDNKIIKNPNLNNFTQQQIIDILIYFNGVHGFNDIDFLPKNFDINKTEATFGFSIDNVVNKN